MYNLITKTAILAVTIFVAAQVHAAAAASDGLLDRIPATGAAVTATGASGAAVAPAFTREHLRKQSPELFNIFINDKGLTAAVESLRTVPLEHVGVYMQMALCVYKKAADELPPYDLERAKLADNEFLYGFEEGDLDQPLDSLKRNFAHSIIAPLVAIPLNFLDVIPMVDHRGIKNISEVFTNRDNAHLSATGKLYLVLRAAAGYGANPTPPAAITAYLRENAYDRRQPALRAYAAYRAEARRRAAARRVAAAAGVGTGASDAGGIYGTQDSIWGMEG